jgi:hypothetical protein
MWETEMQLMKFITIQQYQPEMMVNAQDCLAFVHTKILSAAG